jgi:hypothetical protein
VESRGEPAAEGSVKRCLAVVCAPMRAARSMGEKPLDAETGISMGSV